MEESQDSVKSAISESKRIQEAVIEDEIGGTATSFSSPSGTSDTNKREDNSNNSHLDEGGFLDNQIAARSSKDYSKTSIPNLLNSLKGANVVEQQDQETCFHAFPPLAGDNFRFLHVEKRSTYPSIAIEPVNGSLSSSIEEPMFLTTPQNSNNTMLWRNYQGHTTFYQPEMTFRENFFPSKNVQTFSSAHNIQLLSFAGNEFTFNISRDHVSSPFPQPMHPRINQNESFQALHRYLLSGDTGTIKCQILDLSCLIRQFADSLTFSRSFGVASDPIPDLDNARFDVSDLVYIQQKIHQSQEIINARIDSLSRNVLSPELYTHYLDLLSFYERTVNYAMTQINVTLEFLQRVIQDHQNKASFRSQFHSHYPSSIAARMMVPNIPFYFNYNQDDPNHDEESFIVRNEPRWKRNPSNSYSRPIEFSNYGNQTYSGTTVNPKDVSHPNPVHKSPAETEMSSRKQSPSDTSTASPLTECTDFSASYEKIDDKKSLQVSPKAKRQRPPNSRNPVGSEHRVLLPNRGYAYRCKICFTLHPNKSDYQAHLRTHSRDLRPYRCSIPGCGQGFAKRAYLIVHERTHTGVRPYQCTVCLRRFTQKSALNSHYSCVHGNSKQTATTTKIKDSK